ncbi:MAG: hypothetical protein E6K17_03940 [Methanobacteriota archaeon]|nr:MAG: hypothetical protein E6K17_03940 [Euryarchaeota archaeon]
MEASDKLIEMYERQSPKDSRRWLLAILGGLTLLSVQLVSAAFWWGLRPFGLSPSSEGLEIPFTIAGFIGAASALLRYNFKVALVGAILSIFSIGPFASAFLGGLVATCLILEAGDSAFHH